MKPELEFPLSDLPFDPTIYPFVVEAGENKSFTKTCPFCKSPGHRVGALFLFAFRDYLSAKEYTISALCQKCQDKTFGVEP